MRGMSYLRYCFIGTTYSRKQEGEPTTRESKISFCVSVPLTMLLSYHALETERRDTTARHISLQEPRVNHGRAAILQGDQPRKTWIWRFPEIGVPPNNPFEWDFPL